jgi:hypothetical protein
MIELKLNNPEPIFNQPFEIVVTNQGNSTTTFSIQIKPTNQQNSVSQDWYICQPNDKHITIGVQKLAKFQCTIKKPPLPVVNDQGQQVIYQSMTVRVESSDTKIFQEQQFNLRIYLHDLPPTESPRPETTPPPSPIIDSEISPMIDNIIYQRSEKVIQIENDIDNIHQTNEAVSYLRQALKSLLQHPNITDELKTSLQEFDNTSSSLEPEISSVLEQLDNNKIRLERREVTICCSGQARVGKSTLLQTMGNLPDDAIPTGKGIPVTAVRSRLQHSHEQEAIISLRDKNDFIEELVKPFHQELNLPTINSFSDFKEFDYNDSQLATDKNVELLVRLRRMQLALPFYERYLTGKTRKIVGDLTQLRPWVAYPTQEEEESPNCYRMYLAVKQVEINCSFLVGVEKLVLVDLPGLGEINIDAEKHHEMGIRKEVDLVLLILRPTPQSSYWGDKDRKTVDLISRAAEGISKLGDFLIMVVNCAKDDDPELYKTLVNDIHKQINENQVDSRFRVFTCDASNPDEVRENVLKPALQHLIKYLPQIDQQIIAKSLQQWQEIKQNLTISLNQLEKSLKSLLDVTLVQSEIYSKAKTLRQDLSVDLGREIKTLREAIQADKDQGGISDPVLIQAIQEKNEQIQKWSENGIGKGKEEWCKAAQRRFRADQNIAPFAIEEINRARTYITNIYIQLGEAFGNKIEQLWQQISQAVRSNTGTLIEDTSTGKEALEKFLSVLQPEIGSGDLFPSLREATEYLLKLGSEKAIFESHLLPIIIEETQKLSPESFNFSKIPYQGEKVEETVLKMIEVRIVQSSFYVQKAINESHFISNILYSAAVKFEDSIVRSNEADVQFFNFASAYANKIWVAEFEEMEKNNKMVKKVEQSVTNLKELLVK